ncbi:MAG: PTS fructose transporter subunit IIBC, partial [Chloroflexus sp.]|nr:PTS fructose transporter subunit IIBC [Chloroflexus sp.]
MAVIVAITSCPTGIAHTFMAAEGLQRGAESLGHTIKVETQGSVGAENTLTAADIAAAEVVIIAADTKVDLSRFAGKRVYETNTKAAIHDGVGVIKAALEQAR